MQSKKDILKIIFRISLFLICTLLFIGSGNRTISAAILVYDGFNYPVGNLDGNNNGIGWTGAWTGGNAQMDVVAPAGLTYLTLKNTNGHATGRDVVEGIDYICMLNYILIPGIISDSIINKMYCWGIIEYPTEV